MTGTELAQTVLATSEPDRPRWPRWVWATVVCVATVDLAILLSPIVSVDSESWRILLLTWATSAGLILAVHSRQCRGQTYALVTGLAIALSLWPALKILNYVTMAYPLPLADHMLAGWDQALGLDWLAYVRWLDTHPVVIEIMALTYQGLIQYCCFAFILLLLIKGHERAMEFIKLFVISSVTVILLGPLLPAQGAMIYYAPDQAEFEFVSTTMGTYFWPPLQEVRASTHLYLDVTNLPGLVAFPSFHTTMGALLIYVSRGSLTLLVPSMMFNLIMIASTPLFGGHYFVDVIAGIMLAGATIMVNKMLCRVDTIAQKTATVTAPTTLPVAAG